MKKMLFLLLLATAVVSSCFAADNDSLKAQLVRDWQRAKAYTLAYLEAMPADKYGYRPTDSVRSFAEQMLHLAGGNVGLVGNGTGVVRIAIGREKSATAQTKDSVLYYVTASYDYCIDGIKNMDAAKMGEKVKRGNFDESRLAWILKGFEHQGHHRGQCTLYIRLVGIKPPNEMLF